MKIELKRHKTMKDATIGEVFIDGVFECFSLEDVVRPTGKKVYGKTAIPPGTYHILVTMSNRFKKFMPLVAAVPGFEGIRIHPGNDATDTEGCILVGNHVADDQQSITESRVAYEALFEKINAALVTKDKVTITITEA